MAELKDTAKAEIYLGEGHSQMRATLRGALRDLDLEVTDDFEESKLLRLALRDGDADMVILDSDLPGGGAMQIVRDIRHGELGKNPFVPLIVTTWKNEPDRIRTLIDCGIDGLLAKPISISAIRMQVDTIINRRKPFVVTSSYIGPDRRKDPTHTSNAPLIDVPNTLKRKISGRLIDPLELKREIAKVQGNVRTERLRRNGFEISFLVELIQAEDHENGSVRQIGRFAQRLTLVAKDTVNRILESSHAHNAEICKSLLRVSDTIVAEKSQPGSDEIGLLKPLADAILLALNPDREAADLANEINQSIAQFKSRQSKAAASA